jgi:hypothetical protein
MRERPDRFIHNNPARNFSIETPYELVPKEKMDAVFEPGTGLGWEAFYKN